MRRRSPLASLLLAVSIWALLLAGLAVMPAPGRSESPMSLDDISAEADGAVLDDEIELSAARHTRVKATRFQAFSWDVIFVDVNPTLPGKQSYKVVLKVRHQGRWQRCAVTRTENRDFGRSLSIGANPDEIAAFIACRHKANKKYKVIVPAQHGFARTVATPRWP